MSLIKAQGAGESGGFYSHTIDQSLRFNDDDSPRLSQTFSSGDTAKWTLSFWLKLGVIDTSVQYFFHTDLAGGNNAGYIYLQNQQLKYWDTAQVWVTSQLFRDPNAWYNIVVARDSAQSGAAKGKLYVNGTEITDFATDNRSGNIGTSYINSAITHYIGQTGDLDCYIAEMNFIDGAMLTAESFGETKSGIWIPKNTSGLTFGTNGFRLTFAEAGDLGADSSHTVHDIFGDSSAVATYLFDDDITDEGGTYDGTTSNVTFVDGVVGTKAGVFNGTNSKWVAGTHLFGANATASNISVSGWFQVSSDSQYLIADGFLGTGGKYFAINTSGGKLVAGTGDASGGNNIGITSSTSVTDGEWHHFAFTKSVSSGTATGKLWVDGYYEGSDTTTSTGNYPNETAFGHRVDANGYYSCTLDQIRIFNRVLTDAEVQELAGGYALDSSGVGNHFTPLNLQSTDVVLDTPTNNWCVINPLTSVGTQSEGNLKHLTSVLGYGVAVGSIGVTSGKWYWEVNVIDDGSGAPFIGVVDDSFDSLDSDSAVGYLLSRGVDSVSYYSGAYKFVNGTSASYGATWGTDDIIGVALNLDDNEITFYKNNSSQGTISHTFGRNHILPAVCDGLKTSGTGQTTFILNFGQDSSFAGTETAQGNADDNSVGDFFYSPPSGFLALCSANLPDPGIDPAVAEEPSDYFNTKLFTGNAGTQSITGVGFQPQFLWIKRRNSEPTEHALFDIVRGAGKSLKSNTTTGEQTQSDSVTSLDSDGFSLGDNTEAGPDVNYTSGGTYVSWNWLAGGSASTIAVDSISSGVPSIQSSVSANTEAGFSIVGWQSPGGGSNTIGHGLNSAPEFIITKTRTASVAYNWNSYHVGTDSSAPEDYAMALNTNDDRASSSTAWDSTAPTSSVFSVNSTATVGASGDDMIAYCFHSVDGYSKVGLYHSNNSSDGPFVYTGFRPAWVILKEITTGGSHRDWPIYDNKRSPHNPVSLQLEANQTNDEESTRGVPIDFLSNGFKIRNSYGEANGGSLNAYIFLAFAEQPFKYSNAR